jgi:predicted RNA-binding Zn ribbon-like protein
MGDPEFILLGDAVWLDFINTNRGRGRSSDRLTDAAAYHRWAKASRLRSDADSVAYALVRRFRSRLLRLAEALDQGAPAPAAAISMVNQLLRGAEGRQQLIRESGSWRLLFGADDPPPALVAVALYAAGSLADPVTRVRQCAGAGCTLFFSDSSSAQQRRCCAPAECGSGAWVERRRGALR